LTVSAALLACVQANASSACPEEQATAQAPQEPAKCDALLAIVRRPNALPLNEYQAALGDYLRGFCYRDEKKGWKVDKRVRDTGPWIGTYSNGTWTGNYFGSHAPVLIWYSPDMYEWLKANRPSEGARSPARMRPIPDGAIIVKEMYKAPAAACAHIDPIYLRPDKEGAAIMVRDSRASYDGWFWGWFGWTDWQPDWPRRAQDREYPFMGFGLYCTNCHSSAKDNQTFSSLKNIKGEPGEPLAFLSQNFFLNPPLRSPPAGLNAPSQGPPAGGLQSRLRPAPSLQDLQAGGIPFPAAPSRQSLHARIATSQAFASRQPAEGPFDQDFLKIFSWWDGPPARRSIVEMPSVTYDSVWAKAGPPTVKGQFITSNQCLGCHAAGATGLQYDMTLPGTADKLINISPHGTWSGSPMSLAGRDPIFFAQQASETETFHPESVAMIQDTCLGCHGIQGQRQLAIDARAASGACGTFSRDVMNAVPYPPDDPVSRLANYGALARDGVSCAACHRMIVGRADIDKHRHEPQNRCVEERQASLNPDLTGFARTFTGGFFVGPPDQFYGQFEEPKKKPMHQAIGSNPVHNPAVSDSEMCGSCHMVRLPVLHRGKTVGHAYEQTTYSEWAFSEYRTGMTVDGALPFGAGKQAQSCQDCHMPRTDARGNPYRSKIAAIQEHTNFPQAENTLEPKDIDLPERVGFARHELVGLNIFLLKMAWQFSDILGIRRADPMMSDLATDPLIASQQAMLSLADKQTADISVGDVTTANDTLSARVSVVNRVGHKFPSGVAFRRAFIEFRVLDDNNKILWASGRTNGAGVIVDERGMPIAGELWWKNDCSARIDPEALIHQPHYQVVTRQDQAQIYEELVSTPPDTPAPTCGFGTPPAGQLTTSFLSQCTKVKDNRLLPRGFLGLAQRLDISRALGAGAEMAEESGPAAVGDDPDYRTGGGDTVVYSVPLSEISGTPVAVQATIYYQATAPSYLQDRFCTSKSSDTKRLYYLAGKLSLAGTPAESWKLRVVTTGPVAVR
jgi:hypothetical protein